VPGAFAFHVPNGGARLKIEAVKAAAKRLKMFHALAVDATAVS
jgi:hypothetical protein